MEMIYLSVAMTVLALFCLVLYIRASLYEERETARDAGFATVLSTLIAIWFSTLAIFARLI